MTWGVRVYFDWQGTEVFDEIGPFDAYFAHLVCVDFAEAPYQFGMTPVRVTKAIVIRSPNGDRLPGERGARKGVQMDQILGQAKALFASSTALAAAWNIDEDTVLIVDRLGRSFPAPAAEAERRLDLAGEAVLRTEARG